LPSNWNAMSQSTSCDRRLRLRSELGVQGQQAAEGIADDAAGVIGSEDHGDGADDRLLTPDEALRRRLVLRGLEHVHGLVHLPSVRVRCTRTPQVGARADQRQDGVGETRHAFESAAVRGAREHCLSAPSAGGRAACRRQVSLGARRIAWCLSAGRSSVQDVFSANCSYLPGPDQAGCIAEDCQLAQRLTGAEHPPCRAPRDS
jgi:hypothetical protein